MGLNLANKISIIRILLIPFFVLAAASYTHEKEYFRFVALGIFSIAVVTDVADGLVARAKKEHTRLGSFLDPVADKLLIITSFLCLTLAREFSLGMKLPPWVPITIISRDILLMLGAAIVHLVAGNLQIVPSRIGKATTLFQMITVIGVLLRFAYSYVLWSVAVLLTVVSGLDYIIKGSKFLSNSLEHKPPTLSSP
jgi:CDP-diacylglycerol--glycerol-3-phosphate 3-phosphatidyltransferase